MGSHFQYMGSYFHLIHPVHSRVSSKLVRGHIPDINALPPPDRNIQYKYEEFGKSPVKRFIACRDCPNSCKYCFNHLYHRIYKDEKHRFLQITSVDKIIMEIKEVKNEYGLELVYFNDDDLARDHVWLSEFCEKYKREVGLPFCGSIRANSVNREILTQMRDAGCTFLNIALESSSPDTQKLLRRGNITNEQIEDACSVCRSLGIKVRLQNMIGLPVDNPLKDALDTLEYNQRIGPSDSWAAIFQPFPKTDIWHYCLEKGLIVKGTECMNFYDDTRLKIKDAEKINALHKWWYFIVKYGIPVDVVKILIELPLTDERKTAIQDLRWKEAARLMYNL
jgi:anaerobic magnesium-protoporphyrin IX monomethyl ester cyclase